MADEINIPTHRYYQTRYHVKLAPNEVSRQLIYASGIRKIDNAVILPLFALAEPGVWYDPSDVANLAWRYNLLTFTEAFTNATWLTQGGSWSAVDANGFQTFTEDTATSQHRLYDDGFSVVSGQTYTLSAQVAYGTRRWVFLAFYDGVTTVAAWFDLLNGVKGSVTAGATSTMTTVSSGVYNITLTRTAGATSSAANVQIGPQFGDNETVNWTGTGATTRIAKYQFELSTSSTPQAYQRISDVNTEVMERFPKATLFTDSAGTTPVTAPAQTVGLMLDKSQGLVLGSELVTNGDFASGTGWTLDTGITISGGLANFATASNQQLQQTLTFVSGKTYKITLTVTSYTSGAPWVWLGQGTLVNIPSPSTLGTKTIYVTSGSGDSLLRIGAVFGAGATYSFDNISVKLLAGNHATQATLAQRPTYGINPITGTRNLLTRTEEFDNAVWTKNGLLSVTANFTVAPDGTTTAEQLIEDTSTGEHRAYQNFVSIVLGSVYTVSFYAKAAGRTLASITSNSGVLVDAVFDIQNGTVTSTIAGTASISNAGNGWYRIAIQNTASASDTTNLQIRLVSTGTNTNYTGNGTSGILIWGAQLELGSTATAYQKVVSQYEVTEAGVQSAGYLAFDGVDDGMVTNTITPAIDKVQVFAGVRKLSDAAIGIVAELSASVGSNAGSFYFAAPENIGASGNFSFKSRGSIDTAGFATSGTKLAPISAVITALGDISADRSTIRFNGTQTSQSTADQGTGNLLAYPLYLGRRGGSSFPYNGRIYSLITRFGANLTDGQITSTESWVNSKTGGY